MVEIIEIILPVACFRVRVSVMFHLMFVHYTFSSLFGLLSDKLLGNSCALGWLYVLIVFCLFLFLFISHFDSKGGI